MFSIICSFFLPVVAQNADACAFWKLTFNRDFRSTEFQEIKINSCPALAASWGQCLLRGMLGTTEIFRWRSSSSLVGCAPCPTQHFWAGTLHPLPLFPSLSNFPRVFTNIRFTVITHKGALNSLWGSGWVSQLSSKHPSPSLIVDGMRPPLLPPLIQGHAAAARRI